MTKYLRVTMPDGSTWHVPADLIANDRAHYYATKENGQETYDEEYKFTLEDNTELIDWAINNMNWADVKEFAFLVPRLKVDVDYQEGWVNGEHEVIECDE
ncbi:hypothetical protein LCGC14_0534290 [marine sediment metagenome]|uniref:Uncharacterized protein n=1 Tax=marine sediment metagenome TaxID=412755 RepID=A0A0F9RUU3_9ZZZZ